MQGMRAAARQAYASLGMSGASAAGVEDEAEKEGFVMVEDKAAKVAKAGALATALA